MTQLFEVEPSDPQWVNAKIRHNITVACIDDTKPIYRATYYPKDRGFVTQDAETEKMAVISLIHALKLPGWDELSANP